MSVSATGTSSPLTKILGGASLIAMIVLVWLGLFVTPPDQVQGDLVRMIYIHPAVATTMYLGFSITAGASVLYLYPPHSLALLGLVGRRVG